MTNAEADNSRGFSQPFSWKRVIRWTLLCGVPIVVVFGIFVGATDCNGFKQRWNMEAVEKHIATKLSRVASMPEYAQVQFEPFTGGFCGCLTVHGFVTGQPEADRLREIVLASQPPTEVKFLLYSPLESDGETFQGQAFNVPEIPRPQ